MDLRNLPKAQNVAKLPQFRGLDGAILMRIIKEILGGIRGGKIEIKNANSDSAIIDKIALLVELEYQKYAQKSHQKIINATGVIIHTNLGRAPISKELWDETGGLVCGYANLEFDLNSGRRGDRYELTARLLKELIGCEDAILVNNNAAAVFMVLNTLSKGGEVVVSRGELVEIGGSFRVPEVMASSGSILREVGTTNRTNLNDYEGAINDATKMLLKVHKSNYEIAGFSCEAKVSEIAQIAKNAGLVSYYDLGSGFVGRLPYGLDRGEDNLKKVVKSGVDLFSFSGDKLFGGPQCGVIAGKKALIEKIKKNQLMRMVRPGKIAIFLFNKTVQAYLNKEYDKIPAISQLWADEAVLEERAEAILRGAGEMKNRCEILKAKAFVGGGTMPCRQIGSVAIAIDAPAQTAFEAMRRLGVVGRIENDRFLLDLRSVLKDDLEHLAAALKKLADSSPTENSENSDSAKNADTKGQK